jgi:organic hydroperoxide reductase OsmC/OhrA
MAMVHKYDLTVTWTGAAGGGTDSYRSYDRAHEVTADGPPPLSGSADPHFRGDPSRWNPEQLLLAALSQCHMLSFLSLCSRSGIVVTAYTDHAHGTMAQTPDGGGHFTEVVLRPQVRVADPEMAAPAAELHEKAHQVCFIANSVNFPVRHEPVVTGEALTDAPTEAATEAP